MKTNLVCAGVVASLGILFVSQSGASAELIITGGDIDTGAKNAENSRQEQT